MPITACNNCAGRCCRHWQEAFAKFGFGDGQLETDTVADALTEAGCEVMVEDWGSHNTVMTAIKKDGVALIPHADIAFGYDDPGDYLPEEIVELLNQAVPSKEHPDWLFSPA